MFVEEESSCGQGRGTPPVERAPREMGRHLRRRHVAPVFAQDDALRVGDLSLDAGLARVYLVEPAEKISFFGGNLTDLILQLRDVAVDLALVRTVCPCG